MTRGLFTRGVWPRVAATLGDRRAALLVALDFDGTLAEIAPLPEGVRVRPGLRSLLSRASHLPRVRVAVVTARRLRDLSRFVPGRGILRVGQYGLEGAAAPASPAARRAVRRSPRAARVRALLRDVVRRHPGAWLEDKGLTLAVHDRGMPPARRAALLRALVPARAEAGRLGFRAVGGRRVHEFVPAGYDKGRALDALRRRIRPAATIYFGDSAGDEPAFAVLGRSDVPVRVGFGTTAARYRVRAPADVARFLRALIAAREP